MRLRIADWGLVRLRSRVWFASYDATSRRSGFAA